MWSGVYQANNIWRGISDFPQQWETVALTEAWQTQMLETPEVTLTNGSEEMNKASLCSFQFKILQSMAFARCCYTENWNMTVIIMCLTFNRHCGDGNIWLNNALFPCILICLKRNSHVIVTDISTKHQHFLEWSFQASKWNKNWIYMFVCFCGEEQIEIW